MPVETKGKYIWVRIKDPDEFAELKWITLPEKDGIYAVYGRKKDSEKWEIQAYRFDKDKWTEETAQKWVKDNKAGKHSARCAGRGMALSAKVPEWVQIFPYGEWEGHPGRSFAIDSDVCEIMAANFNRFGIDLVIDYEHQTETTIDNGQPAPAAAWVDQLEVRDDGLWGHVKEWTDRAEEMLEQKEYRYLSPVWTMEGTDHKTGEMIGPVLCSCGLTNTPFFVEMEPLVAKVDSGFRGNDNLKKDQKQTIRGKETTMPMSNDDFRSALYEILALKEATDEGALAKIQELSAFVKKLQEILGAQTTDETALAASVKQLQVDGVAMGKVRELLKLSAKADEKEVTSKLYPLLQPKDLGTGVSREEFAALQATVRTTEAEKLVDAELLTGKLTPAMRDWALGYAKDSPEGFQAWAAKAPVIMALGGPKKEAPLGDHGEEITEQRRMIAKQLGLDPKKIWGKEARQAAA
jgi:phage I-like protein